MKKPIVVILANECKEDHLLWVEACEAFKKQVDYSIIELSHGNWQEKIGENRNCDYFLTRPPGLTASFKQLYDERLYIIAKVMQLPVYPTYEECLVYENKRLLAYWLQAHGIPHPRTFVFYHLPEAADFINDTSWPLVAKLNIGASGSGVTILHSFSEANEFIEKSFGSRGALRRWGPNFAKGDKLKRGFHYVLHPGDIAKKLDIYSQVKNDVQRGFVILQEFVPHQYEWRCVRIGNSFFAHKKIVKGEMASGTLLKGYGKPPLQLLDFVKGITDKLGFYSQAVDIFETAAGDYLVNEMQCMFGQSDPYQMLVDDKPGRYIHEAGKWVFEEGDYARNACFDLRLEYIVSKIKIAKNVT